jgi:uncharacterized protein
MNKNRSLFVLIIQLLLIACFKNSYSQISKTPTFLWAIFAKGDTVPSYLYGTIHHLGPKAILDNKPLVKLIWNSKLIVMEADTNELLHSVGTKFNYNVNTPLDQLIGFADYQLVQQEFFAATGRLLENYKNKMPQMIMNQIINGREKINPTSEAKPLMESALYAVSRVKGIPLKGLENKQDMFNIMYKGMSLNMQAKLLLFYLKEMQFDATEEQMLHCFQQQNLDCFCEIDDMTHYTRPGDSIIIINRNQFWLPKMENYFKQKNVFVAVGAAHLCGSYGLVSLLRRKGYMLIPIKL